MVTALVGAGANLDAAAGSIGVEEGKEGTPLTPLVLALHAGHLRVAEFLVEHGAAGMDRGEFIAPTTTGLAATVHASAPEIAPIVARVAGSATSSLPGFVASGESLDVAAVAKQLTKERYDAAAMEHATTGRLERMRWDGSGPVILAVSVAPHSEPVYSGGAAASTPGESLYPAPAGTAAEKLHSIVIPGKELDASYHDPAKRSDLLKLACQAYLESVKTGSAMTLPFFGKVGANHVERVKQWLNSETPLTVKAVDDYCVAQSAHGTAVNPTGKFRQNVITAVNALRALEPGPGLYK